MIAVEGATKSYASGPVVDGVDLTLADAGITAIIGPNGAGKSTLLSMIARLLPLDAGRITVDGLDVSTTKTDVLAKRLSILRQENALTARLTVRDLVSFGRYPHSKGRPTAVDLAVVERTLAYLDLTELDGRFLDELSGGQRQRAFIAMVLAQDTEYVLLDEPLNNLDLKHAAEIMRLLRRAADDLGKRVVLVLHDINFAAHYADRILAMKDGRVAAYGTPDEIVTSDVLGDVYEMDIAVDVIGGKRVALYYG
ncbi:iron ABC transporter ATP-binding protein [Herbiconiux sp. SYSU D00978]|uniref:iron ABC transporter ATP-binding protein n=1 Tax=Herbiconiux sp. SYSU D00978 TaxID=2812562 RepID=UPI001A97189C|nr:ATP-binding cassette domain-containing protein [Herbiconiux sp. SYSU D00978]